MVTPKKPEGKIASEQAILILQDLKRRTCFYDEPMLIHYPNDYLSELAGLETAALERAIQALRNQGE